MNLLTHFAVAGVPETGLTPTITVWELDGTPAVSAQAMTEIAGGFYYYDFSGYDETLDYSILADGGVSLSDSDRYKPGSNEIGQVTEDLTAVAIQIGAVSTHSVADILNSVIDEHASGNITLKQSLMVVTSMLSGLTSGVGTATEIFQNPKGDKDRVTFTFDSDNNRLTAVFDFS